MLIKSRLKMLMILCVVNLSIVNTVCPNGCSGHGVCESSVCKCYSDKFSGENYYGSDCSLRSCVKGNGFSLVSSLSRVFDRSSVLIPQPPPPGVIRELSVMKKDESERGKTFKIVLKGDAALDGSATSRLWKVNKLDKLAQNFPKSGLILNCEFTASADSKITESPVTIISHSADSTYVLFESEVTKGENTPSLTSEYTSIKCNDILSIINDLTQIHPTVIPTPTRRERLLSNNNNTRKLNTPLSFIWEGYYPILKDMGLLKSNEKQQEVFSSNEFVFGCFKPDSDITQSEFTFYEGVEGVQKDSGNNVQFTISGSFETSNTYVCFCVMDYDGKRINLEDSEISENIRKENENEYYVGKYKDVNSVKSEHVAFGSIASNVITITKSDLKDDDLLYFGIDRIVYGTIIEGGMIKEIPFKISKKDDGSLKATVEPPASIGEDTILLPYLRSSPINPLTQPPQQFITKESGETFYKAYYFAEELLSSLKNEGGILDCTYDSGSNRRERMLGDTTTSVDIDVKGIIRDSKNVVIYSYIEIETSKSVTKDNFKTVKCSGIKSNRNDMTMYYKLSELTVPGTGSGRQLSPATPPSFSWDGYGPIFTDMKFAGTDNVNFGCFNKDDKTKEIKTFAALLSYSTGNPSNVVFTFNDENNSPLVPGNYLCFMKTKFNKNDVIVEESDIKDKIVYDNSYRKKYYYGDYIIEKEIRYMKEQNNEVIILSSDSTITLTAGEGKSTIIIPDIDKIPTEIQSRLKPDNEFYLKVMKKNNNGVYEIQTITCINPSVADTQRRSLSTPTSETIIFTPDPAFTDGDIPFYVIYLKEPSERTTPSPINTIIKTIDINSYFYEISNFLEDIKSSLHLIGGKIQCRIDDKNSVGIIDVRGKNDKNMYLKFDKAIINGRRILSSNENEILLENIRDCEILNIRKDMSLYNVIKLDKMNYVKNQISWFGYGNIFAELKGVIVCYSPSSEFDKEMKFYDKIQINRVKNINMKDIYDLKMIFLSDEKPSEGDICYMLSDNEGKNIIKIEESELFNLIRKDKKSGKYYFGKIDLKELKEGKSVENKKEDGSVSITITEKAIETGNSDGDKKEIEKMNIFELNKESPSIGIPPSFIGFESEKMLYAGTTIIIRFIINGNDYGSQSSQIIRIEKEMNENDKSKMRFKIYLSKPISIPPEVVLLLSKKEPRLRSLDDDPIKDTDILIELNWLSEGSTHIWIECSGQGICDRESGLCKCYNGFSGSGCQRIDCPSNCNGNGRCVSLSELLGNGELEEYEGYGNKHIGEYTTKNGGGTTNSEKVQFENQVYGCLCDKRHRGYDCSLIECPSGVDPEGGSNMKEGEEYRDCSGRGICNYSTGVCECFSGFIGEGCENEVETI